MALVTNWFRKGARDTFRKVRVRIARVNSFLQEHLSGIAVVQLDTPVGRFTHGQIRCPPLGLQRLE